LDKAARRDGQSAQGSTEDDEHLVFGANDSQQ
jgi:hypothetical protein